MKKRSQFRSFAQSARLRAAALSLLLVLALVFSIGLSAFAETDEQAVSGGDVAEQVSDGDAAPPAVSDGDAVASPTDAEANVLPVGAGIAEDSVCSVGENGYPTLEEAIAENESGTIVLLKDIAYNTHQAVTVPASKDFVLDLNGKTLSNTVPDGAFVDTFTLRNDGTLTLLDSAGGGRMTLDNAFHSDPHLDVANKNNCNVLANYGSLTISSGTVEILSRSGFRDHHNASGTTLSEYEFQTSWPFHGTMSAVAAYRGSSLTVNGGTVYGKDFDALAVYFDASSSAPVNVTVNAGTLTSKYHAALAIHETNLSHTAMAGRVTINGGVFNHLDTLPDAPGFVISPTVSVKNLTVDVKAGTFNCGFDMYNNTVAYVGDGDDTNVNISGGTFTNHYLVYDAALYGGSGNIPFITGGRYVGEDKAYQNVEPSIKEGYIAIFEYDGESYTKAELDELGVSPDDLPFRVCRLAEVGVTPDSITVYDDEIDSVVPTYTLDRPEADEFIKVELQLEESATPGDYKVTAKRLKGGITDGPDSNGDYIYYSPALKAGEVTVNVREGGYEEYTTPYTKEGVGSITAHAWARKNLVLVEEEAAAADVQALGDAAAANEVMLYTREFHFERDGEWVSVAEVCRDKTVDITLRFEDKYIGKTMVIYHLTREGKMERYVRTLANSSTTLTVDSLSPFGVAIVTDTLTVTNTLAGTGANADDEFTFTLKLDFPDSFAYNILDKSDTVLSVGSISDGGTFTLKGDQKLVLKSVPVGVGYEVIQTAKTGYTTKSAGEKGALATGGSSAAFTNTKGSVPSGGSDSNDPKTGDDGVRRSVLDTLAGQLCIALANLSLIAIACVIFLKKTDILARVFEKKREEAAE